MEGRLLRFRLSLLMLVQYAVLGAWIPLLAPHLKNLGVTPYDAAWIFNTNALSTILAPLVWSQIADRWFPAQRCIAGCAAIAGTCLWLLADQQHPANLIVGFFAYWMFQMPVLSLGTSLSFRHLEHPEREFGKIRMWGTVGWVAASWLLALWFNVHPEQTGSLSYSDALRFGAILTWSQGIYALTLPHTPPTPSAVPVEGRWLRRSVDAPLRALALLRRPTFAVYCVCLFGAYVTWPFNMQMMPLLLQKLGLDRSDLLLVLTIAQSSEIMGLGLLSFWLTTLGQKRTMLLGLTAWLGALAALSWGEPLGLVIASLGLHGLYITGFLIAGQVFFNRQAEPDFRASMQGVFLVVNGAGLLVGNLLVGWLRTHVGDDYPRAFCVALALVSALMVVFVLGFRTKADA